MNILVTGSKGTLGTPLVKELFRRGHTVAQCDLQHHGDQNYYRADISNYRQLEHVFEQDYDVVYHLAAEFGRINGEEYYDTMWQTNVIGTQNILEWQRRKGFKLIFASSSEVYGDVDASALTEELMENIEIRQKNGYAISKWVNEQQIMNYEKRYGNKVMRLRFFNAYGPGERYHHYRSVVCLFCYRALHSLPYDVYEGYHRVFMYIDDFIPTLANAADKFIAGNVINIGGTEYRSVRDVSDTILKYVGKDDSLVRYLPADAHNVTSKCPDITKAQKLLGHDPETILEVGIPLTLEWMKEEYNL